MLGIGLSLWQTSLSKRLIGFFVSNASIDEAAANDDMVGTVSVVGNYTGTPSWSINDPSGTFQINSSTGVITVLSNLALGANPSFDVTISVSGVTPAIPDLDETIYVVATAAVIDLIASSDTGSSSTDNITSETEPTLDFTATIYEGDTVRIYNGAALLSSRIITASEVLNGEINFGMALADGTYELTATISRGNHENTASNTLNITIDTAAPSLSSPSGVSTGTTTASISVATDTVSGTMEWCVHSSATPPADFATADGDNGSGAVSASPFTVGATGLGINTSYFAHFKQTDVAGNISSVATSASFTTDAAGAPVITGIAFTSSAGADNTYKAGDVVSATVTFDTGITVTGTPQLTLNVGGVNRVADYASGTGTANIVFSYTIQAGDTDANGISIAANSLALNGGTMSGANLSHVAVTDQAAHKVDTTAPSLSSASATTSGASTANLSAATSEVAGVMYWVVDQSATAPSAAQVKAGQDNGGAAADGSGSGAVSASPFTAGATGLTASTTYHAYFMQEDAAGNQSSVVEAAATFTTDAGSSYDADTVAWADQVVTNGGSAPSTAMKDQVDALVLAIKASSFGPNLNSFFDRLWLVANEDNNNVASLTSLVNPGAAATANGTWTSQTDGWQGNGSTAYIDTGIAPSGCTNFTQNAGSFGIYMLTSRTTSNTQIPMGCQKTTATSSLCQLLPYYTGTGNSVNYAFGALTGPNHNARGLNMLTRSSSTTVEMWQGYTDNIFNTITTSVSPSQAPNAFNFYIGARNSAGTADSFSNEKFGLAYIGGALDDALASELNGIIQDYMTALGLAVAA